MELLPPARCQTAVEQQELLFWTKQGFRLYVNHMGGCKNVSE